LDQEVTLGLAFLAGLASFLSPCVFSLVPAYIGYLGGRTAARNTSIGRLDTLIHGFAFVLGFSFVFVFLGGLVSAFGVIFYDARIWLARIGGIVVIVFGLHLTGLLRIRWLDMDLHPQNKNDHQKGLLSSFLMGIFFSAGWSPCYGPVIGMILTIALTQGEISKGMVLLAAYSLGLGIPFLFAALGVGWITNWIRQYGKILKWIEIGMGVILIIVGSLLSLGVLNRLSGLPGWFNFGL